MSSDGQVSVFSLDNPYADTAPTMLQTVIFPSNLPAWLTPVGQAYRLTSNTPITSSAILFSYLSRDVPPGYENTVRIYYQPIGSTNWLPLSTQLDTDRNAASASLLGAGTYLLVATLEVSPRLVQGWNNIGYSIQTSQTITSGLASIQGSYSIVHSYNPLLAQPWQSFDPSVPISFSAEVNSLTMLEPNHAYWIHATQPVTLYFDVTPAEAMKQLHFADTSAATPSAPAIYYGWLSSTNEFTPKVGMSVTAMMDDRICGETTVQNFAGQLGYVLRILASDEYENHGCGEPGKEFVLYINQNAVTQTILWDNSRTQQIDLNGSIFDTRRSIYLPLINR